MNTKQLTYLKEYRKRTGNASTHKYEKTPNGFLMRVYRNMKSRVTGVQWRKYYLYGGKFLLEKELFYSWSLSNPTFWKLYSKWVGSGYVRKLVPTVDRINSSVGYELENMEWVTLSENSRRSNHKRVKQPDVPPSI